MSSVEQLHWVLLLTSIPARSADAAADCERLCSACASALRRQRTRKQGRRDPCKNVTLRLLR